MRGESATCFVADAVHDVDHARGNSGADGELGEAVRGQRRHLGWFRHAGVAGRDRGRDFPRQQVERQIPGRDEAGDAERLAHRVIERRRIRHVRLRPLMENRGGEKLKILDRARDVQAARERDRFPVVAAFEPRELFKVSLDEIGQPEQQLRSLCHRSPRPRRKRGAGGGDCAIDVACVAIGNLGNPFFSRGIDVLEVLSAGRRHELTADEVSEAPQRIPPDQTPSDRCPDPTNPTAGWLPCDREDSAESLPER